MVPPTPTAAMHTDAADIWWGGTLNLEDMKPRTAGNWKSKGVWNWKDRANSIEYRELKAIGLLLMGSLGDEAVKGGHKDLLLNVDNQAVVHITNAFVSASSPMMREPRLLKVVLDHLGLQIQSEWIPSVANKFTDALARRFPRGDLKIRR